MAEQFIGTWKSTKSENVDEFLHAIGVSFLARKEVRIQNYELIISFENDGDEWTMTSSSLFEKHVAKFKLGEKFENKAWWDESEATSTFELDGDTLIETKTRKDSRQNSRSERSVQGNTLTIVSQCEDVKCTRQYKKLSEQAIKEEEAALEAKKARFKDEEEDDDSEEEDDE